MGGVDYQTILVALRDDILTMPPLQQTDPSASGNVSQLATVSADAVFKTNARWKKLKIVKDSGELTDEGQGPTDGESFKTKFSCVFSDIDPNSLGNLRLIKNKDLVLLVTDRNSRCRIVGHEIPARLVTPKVMTGKAPTDARGIEMNFECDSNYPAPVYTGAKDETGSGSAN